MPEPQMRGLTRWVNPTSETIKFTLHTGVGNPPFIKYEIPPNGSEYIATEYDYAIQHTDENGTIVGGHAPQLQRDGQKRVMHPSIDSKEQQLQAAEARAREALRSKDNAERELLVAKGQAAEIEIARRKEEQASADLATEQKRREAVEAELAELRAKLEAKLEAPPAPVELPAEASASPPAPEDTRPSGGSGGGKGSGRR